MNYYNEFDPKAAAWLRELIRAGLIPTGDVDTRSITEIKPHELTRYTQCHFFAGIGGWSLALQLAGWDPARPVWTGSCPCQPFSSAGKQLAQADARHLWPVFFNLIRECRPLHVFGEQVASAIGKGWLDGVSSDLEGAGYACGAAVLGAHSVGAPHIRQRLYWVADADGRLDGTERARANQRAVSQANGRDSCGLADASGERRGRIQSDAFAAGRTEAVSAREAESGRRGGNGWQRVVFSGDTDEDGNCPVCGIDYADCGCPGPTQDDEFEYEERDGILYARRLVLPVCARLEGHTGHGDDGDQPGRLDADAAGPAPKAGGSMSGKPGESPANTSWSVFDLIPCADGKARRIEPGLVPLVAGLPRGVVPSGDPRREDYAQNTAEARVMRLRGYGNSIVPQLAAEFIAAFLES